MAIIPRVAPGWTPGGVPGMPLGIPFAGIATNSIPVVDPNTSFPTNVLGIKVELLVNFTWTDITNYVFMRNDIVISGVGRADEQSSVQASQVTLTLDNTGGRFSPKNTAGAYYPFIGRNVQLRISVSASSSTLVAYSGYRFWGEVSEWPPQLDQTGNSNWVDITVSGIWRRILLMTNNIGSAYLRYHQNIGANNKPQAYWAMEDGTGSLNIVSPIGGINATFTGAPSFSAGTTFAGSDAILALNAAAITATVPAGGTPTNNVTRFIVAEPVSGDSASGTVNWNLVCTNSAGTIAKFECYLNYNGTLLFQLRNSGGSILASVNSVTNVKGIPVLVSMELTPSGGNVAYAARIITPGAAAITESLTGTISSASIGAVSTVQVSRASALYDTCFGHLSVSYVPPISLVAAAYALNGYAGEFAMDRFARLCSEFGIATSTIGINTTTAPMGPQTDSTFPALLQTVEDTDCGVLYETRDQFGLGYRSNASMLNQARAVTFDYAAGSLASELRPVYDDQLSKNTVIVTDQNGYSVNAVLTTGAMSINPQPNGIGQGYSQTRTVCVAADSQVGPIASFLLGVGGVDDLRIPTIKVNLARPESAAQFNSVPSLRVGDYVRVSNPPSSISASPIDQLTWGFTETLNAFRWTFEFNTIPESPWLTGFSAGTVASQQIIGSPSIGSASAIANAVSGIIQNSLLQSPSFAQGIVSLSPNGMRVTISAIAPLTPNVNDIWISSTTGLISQWDGAVWQPIKFDGSATIQAATVTSAQIAAGTIVASNIAGNTITAGLLAAGIVVAGIVDTTTLTASTLLIYSGTPAPGSLVGSFASQSGTDPFGTTFGVGVTATQGNFTGVTIGNAGITGSTIQGGTVSSVAISDPAISGGSITETAITLDQVGGVILVYQSTTTTVTISAGTATWTAPAGNYSSGKVECWGADAGGDGGTTSSGGPGSGGGAYGAEANYPLIPGDTYNTNVGAAGQGGLTGHHGTDGGQTDFDNTGVTAKGGKAATSNTGGAGGVVSGNSSAFAGGKGGDWVSGAPSAGGGGRAGSTGAGGPGGNASGSAGAAGAAGTGTGGHAGGAGVASATNGLAGGGGSGAGQGGAGTTYKTIFYDSTGTASYYGAGVGGGLRNTNGSMFQGDPNVPTNQFPGDQVSFANYDHATMATDWTGWTIDQITITLNNQHSWYNTGCYCVLGWFSTAAVNHYNTAPFWTDEGVTNGPIDITSAGFITNVPAGTFGGLIFGPSSATSGGSLDLWNYGYFQGGVGSGSPRITISGHQGSTGSFKGGAGQAGSIKITYVNGRILLGALAPVAGTDSASNAYGDGWTGPVHAIQPGSANPGPAIVEVWHDGTSLLSAAPLWQVDTDGRFRYRKTPDNEIEIDCFHLYGPVGGAQNNGVAIMATSFGTGYVPAQVVQFPVGCGQLAVPASPNNAGAQCWISSGKLNVAGVSNGPAKNYVNFCQKIPLD